jgi:hypothetical protein
MAAEPACPDQNAGRRSAALVLKNLDIGEPGGPIDLRWDGDVDEVPAGAAALAAAATGDAVSDTLEAGQLLDVEMQGLARAFTLMADDGRLGIEGRETAGTVRNFVYGP